MKTIAQQQVDVIAKRLESLKLRRKILFERGDYARVEILDTNISMLSEIIVELTSL